MNYLLLCSLIDVIFEPTKLSFELINVCHKPLSEYLVEVHDHPWHLVY
jgi:hypothetical protein